MQHQVATHLVDKLVALDSLANDPANLRLHPEDSVKAIKASLQRFGQQRPVLVDAAGVVVAGNGVLLAARELGWTHIAAVSTSLAGVERVAYGIADNRLAELSEWDKPALAAIAGELPADLLQDIGWTEQDVGSLVGELEQPVQEQPPIEPLKHAVSRTGDLWALGNQRLLCGDSTDLANVQLVLDGRKACLVQTDPPYVINYTGKRGTSGKQCGKDWSQVYREIDIPDGAAFFAAVTASMLAAADDLAAFYVWHSHQWIGELQRLWRANGLLDHQMIVWVKPSAPFSTMEYHPQFEPCIMGWRKGTRPHRYTPAESSVWECDWEGKGRVVGNEHPTQKPLELFAKPMRKHTQPGDVCFEPFSGSGTQLLVAQQLGRVCCAIEIQPVFVDLAIRRWQTMTGGHATLVGDGRTWAELASERGVSLDATCPFESPSPAAIVDAPPSSQEVGTALPTPSSTKPKRGRAPKAARAAAAMEQPGDT